MTPVAVPLPPPDALLAEAEARLRRLKGYARPLSAPRRARALEAGLAAARSALVAEVRPGALWQAVPGEAVPLPASRRAEGAATLLWLCTLGEDGAAVRAKLSGDYMLVHLAGALAQQALYAAARVVRSSLAAAHPGRRLRHVALRAGADDAAAAGLWDAAAVARLLPLFGPAPLGVTEGEAGGFRPAYTLLGVALVAAP